MACPGVLHTYVLATRLGMGTARQVRSSLTWLPATTQGAGQTCHSSRNARVYSASATSADPKTTPVTKKCPIQDVETTPVCPVLKKSPTEATIFVGGGKTRKYKIAAPFEDIPGPKPWPIIGNKLLFTPIGGYSQERILITHERLHAKYGPIVRIAGIIPGAGILNLYRPEDIKRLFQIEGNNPVRPPLDILACYRENRPQYFPSAGLVSSNGSEWHRLRAGVHRLMRPDMVNKYKERLAVVAQDLVHLLNCQAQHQDNGGAVMVKDMLAILMQYTLEGVGVVSIGSRFGCLSAEGTPTVARNIIDANATTLKTLGECYFLPPIHRLIPTKHFRALAASQDTIVKVVEAELKQRYHEREVDPVGFSSSEPLLESLMAREELSKKDVLLLVTEILQGGIDATATTLGFCLYFISRHPKIQHKLWEELKDVDPMHHNLQGLPYMRSIIKETYRLCSPATSISRFIQKDTVISGFYVPKGTLVNGVPRISSKSHSTFPFSDDFIPERWITKPRKNQNENTGESIETSCLENLTDDNKAEELSAMEIASISSASDPYSIIPFSHGARMCPGRRLAEQEIYLAIIALVRAFRLEWVGVSEVGQVQKMNLMPDNTFDIKFTPR